MKRYLVLTSAVAAAVAIPATAVGHGSHGAHRATVLRATLKPVQADIANYTNMRGKAQFVANKHNAKISIHLKGMVPGTTYPWAIVKGTDADTVCATGTPVTGLKYRTLKAGKSGNANSKAYAKKNAFTFDKTATYAAIVYQTGTTDPLLCGVFKKKSHHQHSSAKHHTSPSHKKGHTKP